ncbi:MAG: glycogen debranching enzyme family protein [Opitutae bacterium]|nr:glycogen debranching enzyme family protein [Opitutae bacterium]
MKTLSSPPPDLVRRIEFAGAARAETARWLKRQWLVTNGLGGYASGTISGAVTWRYHGVLVAALPAPFGRMTMLSHLAETLRLPGGRRVPFGGVEPLSADDAPAGFLTGFSLENQLPCWRYRIDGIAIEKRVMMPYLQNTVHVTYTFDGAPGGSRLELRPSVHFRMFEASVATPLNPDDYEVTARGQRFEIRDRNGRTLRLFLQPDDDVQFAHDGGRVHELAYTHDAERGYDAKGKVWSPGRFSVALTPGQAVTFVASTDEWHVAAALLPDEVFAAERARRVRLRHLAVPAVREGAAAELVLAADQFIICPAGRIGDATRARAAGDELRSVIAGYHWFTDWGRDTMISLEGLTLTTGRHQEAAWILRTFAHYVRDGLIPNMFPEGRNEGLYHTADATLWFFHALDRYATVTGDRATVRALLPVMREIVARHRAGTRFGIGIDPADGLLRQGEPGCQLTWMDAKVGDWVVTPRAGKAVELNALWFNAVSLLAGWLDEVGGSASEGSEATELRAVAARAQENFNRRFWNDATGCLFDVIDGEGGASDAAVRPNQLLAVSLRHAVLHPARWAAVVETCERELVTPLGLRTLGRAHPDYKATYAGDLRARDAAYHQGTVWAWLIGPFIDAWLKVHPAPADLVEARKFLLGFPAHLSDGCVGSINEIFDAEPPFTPRGCIAQAWSVAEVLRCYAKTAGERESLSLIG